NGKGKPPKPEPEEPALVLKTKNIISVSRGNEAEFKVWGNVSENDYKQIWSYEISHSAVAIGDVDNDPTTREIVAPHGVKITEGKGKNAFSYNRIFLHVYKEGEKGCWRSTYAIENGSVTQSSTMALYDITIADVDGSPGNEIIIISTEWLLIYQYNSSLDHFQIIGSIHKSGLESGLFPDSDRILKFECVAAEDIGSDLKSEIILSANVLDENGWVDNLGYLLTFGYSDLSNPNITEVDAKFSFESLCTADVNGDGLYEICSPVDRKESDGLFYGYIYVWDNTLYRIAKIDTGSSYTSPNSLNMDVGNVDDGAPGDEMVFTTKFPEKKIVVYNLNVGLRDFLVLQDDISIFELNVADSDNDKKEEIIGTGSVGRRSLLYHVVFGTGFQKEWEYIGDTPDEGIHIWDVTVG
ncbi:MAG: hypothetical protein OEW23_14335, partial [Candidatus Aminicenantes bacterium]|nr:hypothetical protein [Candidatus Aminicenantes bacterium]